MFHSLVMLHRFSSSLILNKAALGQDYDPKGHQSVFQFPAEKFYLPWMTGSREQIHEGLMQ